MQLNPSHRRLSRDLARAGTALSAAMLVFTFTAGHQRHAAATAENAGTVQFVTPPSDPTPAAVTGGGSNLEFSMTPFTVGPACPGSASGTPSYRWQTFMVASTVDVAALTYASGPNAVGSSFVSPMFDSTGNPVVNKNPAASPLGLIAGIPTFSFGAFTPSGSVPAGDYIVGFACTQAGATVKYWSAQITLTAAGGDTPAGFTWAVASSDTTTTTTAAATTTTNANATTTTVAGATTTTAASGVTTTTIRSATTTTLSASFAVTTTTTNPGRTSALPGTGSSSMPTAVWAILLLVFGRMALLLGRPLRVIEPDAR